MIAVTKQKLINRLKAMYLVFFILSPKQGVRCQVTEGEKVEEWKGETQFTVFN